MSIYLWHFPVQCLIKIFDLYFNLGIDFSSKKVWFIYVLITLGVAVISHLFVEKYLNAIHAWMFNKNVVR